MTFGLIRRRGGLVSLCQIELKARRDATGGRSLRCRQADDKQKGCSHKLHKMPSQSKIQNEKKKFFFLLTSCFVTSHSKKPTQLIQATSMFFAHSVNFVNFLSNTTKIAT